MLSPESAGMLLWFLVLSAPWRPWSVRESLDVAPSNAGRDDDLGCVTVLVPARNEAEVIAQTLESLAAQDRALKVILIDDNSVDRTVERARRANLKNLIILNGTPLPPGWSGKLWALEQGRKFVTTEYVLLLDADITMQPGMLATLIARMRERQLDCLSLMAELRMQGLWEKLLLPAFVYFFKLLYPFRVVNSRRSKLAAAAGGCILLKTRQLERIGGFASLKSALIDDCALAYQLKSQGARIWLGLSHSVHSTRTCNSLGCVWNMVARTAFTQLRYSLLLLALCTAVMWLAFVIPLLGLSDPAAATFSLLSLLGMSATYIPTLRYYNLSPLWSVCLPVSGTLFLAMTWTSALRYLRGQRSQWKGRIYGTDV